MTDSQEKSDDLIAELAKLMASNAQGSEGAPKPTVIKLPPLNEATIQTAPVRIPGMEPPKAATPEPARPSTPAPAASPAPAVRIPGLEKPAGAPEPQVAASEAKPATKFDFGKPPAAAPVIAAEPLANWQTHTAPRIPGVPQASGPATAGAIKFEPVAAPATAPKPAPMVARLDAAAAAGPSPATSALPQPSVARNEGIGFDFGFGGSGTGRETPTPANDPIADLITAELDAGESAPATEPTPRPAQPASSAPPMSPAAAPAAEAPKPIPMAIPVRPVSVAPRPAETDKFTVAPVFGLGRPAPAAPAASAPQVSAPATAPVFASAAPRAGSDPLDEIEDLIGEAVRVELGGPSEKRPSTPALAPQPAPVVPPLSTNFAPRRAGLKDSELSVHSAEEAIIAAAAASGAQVGRVEAPASDDRPYKRMKVKPPRTSGISSGARQYVGIAVAGTLLLAAGFGLYWVLGMNRDDPATAPVLTADATPAKVEPVAAPAATAEPSGSVVFNEINGVASADSEETLVSRDETAGATATEVARTVTPEDTTETGLANRKVRTVTVRPDGTIVSGDEAVAGTEALPVDRPNVPTIPGADMAPSDLLTAAVAETQAVASASTAPAAGTDPIAALVADTGAATATPADAAVQVAAIEPQGAVPAVFDGSLVAPIPMPRPASRGALVGGPARPVALEPAAAASANPPASTPLVAVTQTTGSTGSGGGAYVQLSSQPSEADAAKSLQSLQRQMSNTLNGATLEIRRVDLGAKGIWYRVVLPVGSFQAATQTCAAIKSNGGDCVAING